MLSITTRKSVFAVSLMVALTFGVGSASAAGWSCVPFVKSVSDVALKGDAWKWWDAATGHYDRGNAPKEGAVLVFKKTSGMRRGHVAVVREVVNDREIRIDHANWSRNGKVERDVSVIDVSPNNDWSQTRVWYGPIRSIGNSTYPTFGFIYPEGERAEGLETP